MRQRATLPFTQTFIHSTGVRREKVRVEGIKRKRIERGEQRNESGCFPTPNGTRWAGHLKSGFAIPYAHQAKVPGGSATPLPIPLRQTRGKPRAHLREMRKCNGVLLDPFSNENGSPSTTTRWHTPEGSGAQPRDPVDNYSSGAQPGDPVRGLSTRIQTPCLLEG